MSCQAKKSLRISNNHDYILSLTFAIIYNECVDMSSAEEDTHEEEGEEEPSQKYTQAITALPPRVVQQEESQVEVSASPAFQCLDEV